MALTYVRQSKVAIACIMASAWISMTTAAADSYTKEDFPNPMFDSCGYSTNNSTKLCDPAHITSAHHILPVFVRIIQLQRKGWIATIAFVPRIRLNDNKYPSNDSEKLNATREFANYLRETAWKFGKDDNDLVIVISKFDKTVWTSTASGVRSKLSDNCVAEICNVAMDNLNFGYTCVSVAEYVIRQYIATASDESDSWAKSEFPNPQIDVNDCGNNGTKSWICDPSRLLKKHEVDRLDEQILKLRTNDVCEGWIASVAVVSRIRSNQCTYPVEEFVFLTEMKEFAKYLRETSWQFGVCNNDLVIIASKFNSTVRLWTSISSSSSVRKNMSYACTRKHEAQAETKAFTMGLSDLLQRYINVKTGDTPCYSAGDSNTESDNSAIDVLFIVGIIILIVVCIIVVGIIKICCEKFEERCPACFNVMMCAFGCCLCCFKFVMDDILGTTAYQSSGRVTDG